MEKWAEDESRWFDESQPERLSSLGDGCSASQEIKEMQIQAARYHFHLLDWQKVERWGMPGVAETWGEREFHVLCRWVMMVAAVLEHSRTVLRWMKGAQTLWSSNAPPPGMHPKDTFAWARGAMGEDFTAALFLEMLCHLIFGRKWDGYINRTGSYRPDVK